MDFHGVVFYLTLRRVLANRAKHTKKIKGQGLEKEEGEVMRMAEKKYTHSWREFFVAATKMGIALFFTGLMGIGLGIGGTLEGLGRFELQTMEPRFAFIIAIVGFLWAGVGVFYFAPAWKELMKTIFGGDC